MNKPIPDYGDHMTVDEFKKAVDSGCFIDDDGHGFYASDTIMSDVLATPGMVRLAGLKPGFTHVVWFNK